MTQKIVIYRYYIPTKNKTLYVGQTKNAERRHAEHMKNVDGTLYKEIVRLQEKGIEVVREIIDEIEGQTAANALEKEWIKKLAPSLNKNNNHKTFKQQEEEWIESETEKFAEKHNLSLEEARYYYHLWYKLSQCGGGSYTHDLIAFSVKCMEQLFHCDPPLTELEIIKFAAYVAGLSKEMGVER
jgi:predicted GIY-YIG superfamily endonuclease